MHGQILAGLKAVLRAAKPIENDRSELEEYDKVALFNTLMHKPLYCVQLMEEFALAYPESVFSFGEDMKADIMEVKKLALETALEVMHALSKGDKKPDKPQVTPDMINRFFGKHTGISANSTAAKLAEFMKNHPNMETMKQAHALEKSAAFTELVKEIETLAKGSGKTL